MNTVPSSMPWIPWLGHVIAWPASTSGRSVWIRRGPAHLDTSITWITS